MREVGVGCIHAARDALLSLYSKLQRRLEVNAPCSTVGAAAICCPRQPRMHAYMQLKTHFAAWI